MSEEVNVCCPYFRTVKCRDTKEHRHIFCLKLRELVSNNDTVFKCISNYNWVDCKNFNKI